MPCTYDPSAFLFTITRDTVISESSCPDYYEYVSKTTKSTNSSSIYCQYIGYFEAPQTASYYWQIRGDDTAYMWLGNNALDASYNESGTQISGYNYNNHFIVGTNYDSYTPPNGREIDLSANYIYPIRIQQKNNRGGGHSVSLRYSINSETDKDNAIYDFSNVLVHCPSGNSLINPVTQDPDAINPVTPDDSHNHPPVPSIIYDLCMNSKYWTSDVSLNYSESDTSGAVIEILNSMGNVNFQFKQNMRIGMIVVGGGGGGGGGQYTNDETPNSIFSGGGGGGGAIYQVEFDVFQDISFNINVGSKGAQGNGRLGGGKGGDTLIYSNTLYGTIDISAGGGIGGSSQQSVTDGSGGLLTNIFDPASGFNFENKDFYKSVGFSISKGGEFNDSRFDGSAVIIGQDGSGASLGYNNIPGEINYLGYIQQFSGGGGAGYFDSSSNGTPGGLGGQPGKGYGGSGGQSLAPAGNSSLIAGITAEFYGAGGGGAGSNYDTSYSDPPDYVKGGFGGEGILLIYYNVPPSNLNEYYFSEYTFLVDTSIYISPYLKLPTDLFSTDISGVNFLDINTDGIITNNSFPSIGSYNFEVIIKENDNTTSYEFIRLNIVNVLPNNIYYNSNYTFEYNQIVNISPNSPIQNIKIIQLLSVYENNFSIDISGNINSYSTLPPQKYPVIVYITYIDGTYDQENINIIINPPPPLPNLPTTGGPIRICDSRLRNCNYYSKGLPGSSGNVVITGMTQSQILTRLVNLEQYRRGARWVQRDTPTNGYGSREGAPYGYGESPKNQLS